MNEQKKQIVMIAAVVATLGASGYWLMRPSANETTKPTGESAKATRRHVEKLANADDTAIRKHPAQPAPQAKHTTRKPRPRPTRQPTTKHGRPRGRTPHVKPKQLFPAG